jgi:hypothetical protein
MLLPGGGIWQLIYPESLVRKGSNNEWDEWYTSSSLKGYLTLKVKVG